MSIQKFKVGERVKSAHGDWYTNIIEAKEIDGVYKYRITNAGIFYFQTEDNFEKCEQYEYSIKELEKTMKVLAHLQVQHYNNKNDCAVDLYHTILKDISRQIENQKLGK